MMGASGKGRARRGAQAERAAPDLAEADLTTRSADRLARRQHVKGEDLRSTAFRYLLQHGVPGPTWGDREFLPTARRPGRTRQGGASPQLSVRWGVVVVI